MQDKYDILVVPGGAQGAATISKSAAVQDLVREFVKQDKIVGMICAGASSFRPQYPILSIIALICIPKSRQPNSAYREAAASAVDVAPKRQTRTRKT
jgi:hypothetical protein